MTILAWLAVSSLIWGAVIWFTARMLQRSNGVSGLTRQWIWRGATFLLVAPWIAAPLVSALGLGLAPAEVSPVMAVIEEPVAEATAAVFTLDMAASAPAVIEDGGTVFAWLAGLQWFEIALCALIVGWIGRFVLAQLALRSLLGIVNNSRVAEAGVATMSLHGWTQRLGLRRAPRLRIVDQAVSPFSYGVFRPTICLPDGMERQLSREALDLVIGHECLHIARGDGWWRPLERIAADVFWFNPFAWAMRRELDIARELACDEGVVDLSSARHAYARTLRDVAGFSAGLPHAAPAASMSLAGGRSLMLRVSRTLAQAKRKPARAVVVAACVLGVVGAPIAVAQVMLATPRAPQPPAAPAIANLPAPPAPPAQSNVYVAADGKVRASFTAKITEIKGDAANGYTVNLIEPAPGHDGERCIARIAGLGDVSVTRNQTVHEGDVIGGRGKTASMNFRVQCSDDLDGGSFSFSDAAPPAPPAPAEAVAPAEAPEAPEAPAPAAALAPLAAPAAFAAPAPFAEFEPFDMPAPLAVPVTPLSPITPVPPRTMATPRTLVTPPPAPAPPLPGQHIPGAPQPPSGQHAVPPVAPVAPAPPVEPIVLRAPFAGQVIAVETSANGLSKVTLSQSATSEQPLAGGTCTAVYYNVENVRVLSRRDISRGEVIGYIDPTVLGRASACKGMTSPEARPATVVRVKQTINRTPAPFKLDGDTSAVLAQGGAVSASFGYMTDPFSGKVAFHEGVDIKSPMGTPVRTPAAGTVTVAEVRGNYGKVVEVDLGDGVKMRFAHLSDIDVKVGDVLRGGDNIGTVGSSGRTTDPHVHVEVYKNGKSYDPESVENLTLSTR